MKTTFKIGHASADAEPTDTFELWLESHTDGVVLVGRRNGGAPYSILRISDQGIHRYVGCYKLGLPTEGPYGRIKINEPVLP